MTINGKEYPLWEEFIKRKDEFIGKTLTEEDMGAIMETKVLDLTLKPHGTDSAFFEVVGEDFSYGFNIKYGGISSSDGNLSFSFMYGGKAYIS